MKKKIFAIAIALMMLVIYSAAFAWTITIEENDKIGFVIENKICTTNEKVESYGIGIQSIKNMMVKMKGECITKTVGSDFQIILLFPYIE